MTGIVLPLALQLCPLAPHLEAGLAARLECLRWFDLAAVDQAALLAERAGEVRVVVTGGHIGCPPDLMRALPGLQLVAINGVGFDKVDLPLARDLGVAVSNTPDVLTEDVADLAVGLIIAARRGIATGDALVRSGRWPQGELPLGRKVSGSQFGVLGLGRIGRAIADRLAPFGEVAYTSRSAKPVPYRHMADARELARWADVLVIACAANAETAGMVDCGMLEALGPEGWLVNVSRGSVVDEAALIAALEAGTIAGAALDVFADEPHVPEALRRAANTVLTPHVGSASVETRLEMARLVLANVDAVLDGDPPVTPVP
jgi:lactate dehydrogenase-like 2-hydroxyacid dehydrogenase